jgi:periplasmic divalent cation tolerance protein
MECVEIQITCGSDEEATRLADALVERRQAACVQQLPIRSTYRWRGRVEHDEEVLLLVKTTADRATDVEATVDELHSYDLPALTVTQLAGGKPLYLTWIREQTRP